MRRGAAGLVALLIAPLLAACGDRPPARAPATATPTRVISLAPSMTETLIALGLGERLIGISDYCPAVAATAGHAAPVRLGGLNNLNVESVLELHPDLFMTVEQGTERNLVALADRGIPIFSRDPESIDAVFESIEAIGDRFDVGPRARELTTALRARLAQIAVAAASHGARPRVYVEVDHPPPFTIGRHSFVRDALVAAGADNLFDDLERAYPTVDPEAVVTRDPDWILVLHPLDLPFAQRAGFAAMRAVRSGRVITDLDRDALLHSSPRLVDGIEALAARLGVLPASAPERGR